MLAIVNVSPESTPDWDAAHRYELRINNTVLCEFEHIRHPDGVPDLLRAAAAALDVERSRDTMRFLRAMMGMDP